MMVQKIGKASLIIVPIGFFWGIVLHSLQITSSFVLGVLLWALPSCYFVNKLFRCFDKVSPVSLLGLFYRAEIIKLFLSGILFVAIVKLVPSIHFLVLVAGYFLAQLSLWIQFVMQPESKWMLP